MTHTAFHSQGSGPWPTTMASRLACVCVGRGCASYPSGPVTEMTPVRNANVRVMLAFPERTSTEIL